MMMHCSPMATSPCSSQSHPSQSICRRHHQISNSSAADHHRPSSCFSSSSSSHQPMRTLSASASASPPSSGSFRLRLLPELPLPLLLFLFFLQAVHGAPTPDRTIVPVGSVFLDTVGGEVEPVGFPSWARLNATSGQIYGIPQAKDIGSYQIKGITAPIAVVEREESRCDEGLQTIWLEIVDQRRLAEVSMEDQFRAIQSLHTELGVQMSDLRLFPHSYLQHYRTVTNTLEKPTEEPTELDAEERMVITLNISCGTITVQAAEIISIAEDNELIFQVVQGHLGSKPTDQGPQPVLITKPSPPDSDSSASSFSPMVPVVILVIIVILIIFVGVLWKFVKRAKAQRQKRADLNGKGPRSTNARDGEAQLPSSPNDSTTPMLDPKNSANGSNVPGQ